MYYTYIAKCADNSLYCGYTDNIENRERMHNLGKGAKYTRSRLPLKIVYYEEFETKSEALKREYAIKKLTRRKKLELIKLETSLVVS